MLELPSPALIVQSVGAVEETDCTSAEGYHPPHTHSYTNECPGYDTKPSNGKAPVLEL